MSVQSFSCVALRCRSCGREYELEAFGVCARCFGPLDPVYDWDSVRRSLTLDAIEAGPPSLWRYAPLLPVSPPPEPRLAPGLTPLVAAPRLYGGQAQGCAPVASAFAEERKVTPVKPRTVARSLAIGNPADGDLAVATARESFGAIYAVPEDEVGENMSLLAETTGVFGETAAGVTLGALREAVRRGQVGERDTVVLLVTGDGLKTPQPIAGRVRPIAIEADADALLDRLGVEV